MASFEAQERESERFFTPESPFLETPSIPSTESHISHDFEERFWEADSPFLHDVYTLEASSPLEAEFSQLLSEMYDESFNDVVREMAAEAVAQNIHQLSTERLDSESAQAHAEHVLQEHFAPLADRAEAMFEQFAQALGRYDVQSLTEAEVDRIAEQFYPVAGQLSPTFEEFLGKVFKKATSFVKGAVNLAKKGVGALAKLGLGPIIKKLKKFVWPLLKRVIKFALGKLPANLRPLAQKLASKLLGTKEAEAFEPEGPGSLPAAATGEHVQFEFDIQAVQLLFAGDETEMEEFVGESVGGPQHYADPAGDLHRARERLIGELSELHQGQSAAPAIQNFLPAALVALQPIAKIAIGIIGRQKVVNFLAGFLAKLIQKYVGAEGATMLSRAVADVGLRLLGLEVGEQNRERLGYETVAATLEQTLTNLVAQPEYIFEDETLLEAATLEAFESAVQTNFPAALLKPELQVPDPSGGSFVMMPKTQRRKYYKKYIPVHDVEITPAVAKEVKTFGQCTLEQFFREQLLLPDNKPVKAKLHIYEAICGTWLGYISQMETSVGGLGTYSRQAYYQFHPLTAAAAVALKVPGLGVDVAPEYLAGREALAIGQRVYYLELPGLGRGLAASSYVRIEIDLRRYEIRLYIYLSEKRTQEIAQQLRTSGAVAGALQTIAESIGALLETVKAGGAGKAVKVIRETLEPEQLTLPTVASVMQGAKSAAGAVGSAVGSALNAATAVARSAASTVSGVVGGGLANVGALAGAGAAGGGTANVAAAGAGAGAGVGAAIGQAALKWLVSKVLEWANQALGKWLVANKELFIKHASDPSKKGVTIIVTFNPTQDLFKRLLLATFYPVAAALPVTRVELVAGPR